MMLFLLLLAILPVILLLFFIYAKDSYEKEPIKLLIGLVVLGIVSAIPAIILEEVLQSMIDPIFGVPKKTPTYAYHFIIAFLGVAVVEEFVKFMAAFFPTWNHPAFNFKFDGIVYCFYASMGFALIENILYIFGARGGGLGMAIGRALLAIPAHGMFSVFMGYYYGEAKYNKVIGNKQEVSKNIMKGFGIATVLHGFYDFCLFTQNIMMIVVFFAFVIVADIFTIRKILSASKKNTAIYNMPIYQQYWVNPVPAYGPQGLYNPTYMQGGAPAPYGQAPAYNQAPAGQNPYAQPVQGQPSYAQAPAGHFQAPQNQSAYGQTPQNQQAYSQAPQTQQAYSQAPQTQQAYSQVPQTQQTYGQAPAYNQAANMQNSYNQNAQPVIPKAEESTSILRREAPRMIYCPTCHNICDFNSFFCGKCASPIHSYGQA